jgi:hypothetical protein
MADNPSERGTRDRARVNVNRPHELRYWAHDPADSLQPKRLPPDPLI